MQTFANPTFSYIKWGLHGFSLHMRVILLLELISKLYELRGQGTYYMSLDVHTADGRTDGRTYGRTLRVRRVSYYTRHILMASHKKPVYLVCNELYF